MVSFVVNMILREDILEELNIIYKGYSQIKLIDYDVSPSNVIVATRIKTY